MLDGVFNHVSRRLYPAFQELVAERPLIPRSSWFRLEAAAGRAAADSAATFEGHHDLVVLNHDAPQVEDLVADVMVHWLDRGASGWRLDAAYAVPPPFWARVLPACAPDIRRRTSSARSFTATTRRSSPQPGWTR